MVSKSSSSSTNGKPIRIDYRELLGSLRPDTEDWGGLVTVNDIVELVGLSPSTVERRIAQCHKAGVQIRVVRCRRPGGRTQQSMYSAKDVYEVFKES